MSIDRTLLIYNMLKEKSSKDKAMSIKDISELLKEEDYSVSRYTLKNDINELVTSGFKIVEIKERHNTSKFYVEGEFSTEECRIILDGVYSNKFLRREVKNNIKEKIFKNLSYRERSKLRNKIRIESVETEGIDVVNNIYILHQAIYEKRTINFIKLTRNFSKKIIKDKEVNNFICKEIYFYNARYYLIGLNEKEQIRNYRIDRISNIKLQENHSNDICIDLEKYYLKNFDMFGGCKLESASFKIRAELINSVLETFGNDVGIHKSDSDDFFILSCDVGINKGLVRWILKQGSSIKVIHPTKLVDMIKNEINKIVSLY